MSIVTALSLLLAPGFWQLHDATAPLDGRRDIAAGLEADSTIQGPGGIPSRPILVVMCDGRRPAAALQWAGYLGVPSYDIQVSWRVDDGPIHNQRWWIPRGNVEAVQLRNAGWSRELFQALSIGRTIVFRVRGYSGDQDAIFTVPVDRDALNAVKAVCP